MIIVTGAAGFIGSVLVHELNRRGIHNLILVDDWGSDDRWLNLRGAKFEKLFGIKEFLDFDWPLKNHGIDAVYHMGACSDTTENDMDFLYRNNTLYTNKIFEKCTQLKIPFCYASSAATYGAGDDGYNDDHEKVHKLKPLNKYGYSKQLSDEWVLCQKKTPPKWFGVKFFNVFGPHEYHKGKMSSVVFHAFEQIKANGNVKLFKSYKSGFLDGEQKRDFVYVKDVVNAMLALMNLTTRQSGIYNLGTGNARTFYDLAKATFAALDLKPKIDFIEMPDHLKNQYQYFTEADMKKFKKALPKFKFMSLEDAVADYVQNYLNQPNRFMEYVPGKKNRWF